MSADNFFAELKRSLQTVLSIYGYSIPTTSESELDDTLSVVQTFLNIRRRRPAPIKRQVLWSDTIYKKTSLLPKEQRIALNTIVEDSAEGKDLACYMSTSLASAGYLDRLFNDWGIHHFHLHTKPSPKHKNNNIRFVERTKFVLLAYIRGACMYLLTTEEHGANVEQPWYDKTLIEILHRNWPDAISEFRCPNAHNVSLKMTRESVRTFRGEKDKKNPSTAFTTLIEVEDGTVYMPMGGGLATNGMSGDTVAASLRIMSLVTQWQKYLDGTNPDILSDLQARVGNSRLPDYRARLCLSEATLWFNEILFMDMWTFQQLGKFPM